MRWYKSRWGLKRRIFIAPGIIIFLIIFFFSLAGIFLFRQFENNLKPTILSVAEIKAHSIAVEAMNQALYEQVLIDTEYEELIAIHKDAAQRVTLMQANTVKISRVLTKAALEIKKVLNSLETDSFQIPVGQALDSPLLAHWGPQLKVKLTPLGTVHVNFLDDFQQAGINQTRHLLYLQIKTTIQIIIPLATETIDIYNQVPIAETIIVGEVPDTYLGLDAGLFTD